MAREFQVEHVPTLTKDNAQQVVDTLNRNLEALKTIIREINTDVRKKADK